MKIALFVYNRPEHTARTLAALASAETAKQQRVVVFSDGARSIIDADKVQQVRQICSKAYGFAQIDIVERAENYGLARNIIEGVSDVFHTDDEVVVLEDDIVVSPGFIVYMQAALDFYRHKNIFAIGGYTPPIDLPLDYQFTTFAAQRNCSWGWATWRSRWQMVDWQVSDFHEFIRNSKLRTEFNLCGNDLTPMLLKQQMGEINSWSIRFCYAAFCAKMPCIFPIKSLITNAGADGSGTNVGNTSKYHSPTANELDTVAFCPTEQPLPAFTQQIKRFYDTSLLRKVINWQKRVRYCV